MKEYDYFYKTKGNSYARSGLIILLFALFACLSCNNRKHPRDILSRDEMVQTMSELYITEEKVNRLGLNHDSAAKVFNYFDDKVFEKLGTTDATFKRSMTYYMERPQELAKIYAALIDSLNLREQRLSIPPK